MSSTAELYVTQSAYFSLLAITLTSSDVCKVLSTSLPIDDCSDCIKEKMSHHTPRKQSRAMGSHGRRGGQQNPQGRFPPANPNVLHGEVQRLSHLLEMESARRSDNNQKLTHLETELEEMKLQIKKQKALKETFINQTKEANRKLERVEEFNDPAVLKAGIIAFKVQNDVKYMKRKSLEKDFEELKVAHQLSQEAFAADIQAERKKNQALQEELNQLQTSYKELRSKYEGDDALLRQEAETQEFQEARLNEEQQLLENPRAEKDEMSQKIAFLQESEKRLQEELTQLRRSYDELNFKYESNVSVLKQDVERYQEVKHEKDTDIERENENLQLIKKLRAEKEELSQKMSRDIRFLQKREKQMLHELDQVHISYEELKCRYERDIMDIQQQVETYEQKIKQEETALSNREKNEKLVHQRKHSALQQQVEKLQQQIKEERKAHLEETEEDKVLLDKLRAEKEELFQQMSGEITIRQKREKQMLHEQDQVNVSHQELKCRFETEIMNLQQDVERYQQQIKEEKKAHLEKTEEDLALLGSMKAEYDVLQENSTTEIKFLQEKERSAQAELEKLNGSSSFFGLSYSHRPATGTLEKDRVVTPEQSGRVPEQTGDNRK
ncbi:trichohyalin-like isoform X2 [Gambusia affinis]|uniref:trichohyalin-like isoform X2 n=1 Tax=Gambusia affinis TaxID=33528 RepID=UPI001CDB74CC|nr:trichohyalin-like isoform X2 [Gambusia affinis]